MYVKIFYKEKNKNLKSLRAVDRNDKNIEIECNEVIGLPLDEQIKRQISILNKGFFVTQWVRE